MVNTFYFNSIYSASRLGVVYFDLSPNLSPTRREALKLAPFPAFGTLRERREGGWGLGLSLIRYPQTRQIIHNLHSF
jgi:hypothetical protein